VSVLLVSSLTDSVMLRSNCTWCSLCVLRATGDIQQQQQQQQQCCTSASTGSSILDHKTRWHKMPGQPMQYMHYASMPIPTYHSTTDVMLPPHLLVTQAAQLQANKQGRKVRQCVYACRTHHNTSAHSIADKSAWCMAHHSEAACRMHLGWAVHVGPAFSLRLPAV
jgi:hypothetical protein